MRFIPLILTIIVFIYGGFWSALATYFISSIAMSVVIRKYGLFQISGALNSEEKQQVFFKTVFVLMGRVAKADNRVSEEEVAHVEAFMKQLNMSGEARQKAISWFKSGTDKNYDINNDISIFLDVCGRSTNSSKLLLMYVMRVSIADGVIDETELNVLKDISNQLGLPEALFRQMIRMLQAQGQFSSGRYQQSQGGYNRQQQANQTQNTLKNAYHALGVEASNSDSEIKKAYSKLMREYHPDKLMGKGVPADMIEIATEKTKEIQAAYNVIKQSRKKS